MYNMVSKYTLLLAISYMSKACHVGRLVPMRAKHTLGILLFTIIWGVLVGFKWKPLVWKRYFLEFGGSPTIKRNKISQISKNNPTFSLKFDFGGALDECKRSTCLEIFIKSINFKFMLTHNDILFCHPHHSNLISLFQR